MTEFVDVYSEEGSGIKMAKVKRAFKCNKCKKEFWFSKEADECCKYKKKVK